MATASSKGNESRSSRKSTSTLLRHKLSGFPRGLWPSPSLTNSPEQVTAAAVHPAVSTTIDVLVALANRRAGLRFRPTVELLRERFGPIGCSSLAGDRHVRGRRPALGVGDDALADEPLVWPRHPHLAIFEIGGFFGPRLTGLALRSTTEHASEMQSRSDWRSRCKVQRAAYFLQFYWCGANSGRRSMSLEIVPGFPCSPQTSAGLACGGRCQR